MIKGFFILFIMRWAAYKVSVFEVILVGIFLHLNWIRKDKEYLSVLIPNAGKYGPEKLQMRTLIIESIIFKTGF